MLRKGILYFKLSQVKFCQVQKLMELYNQQDDAMLQNSVNTYLWKIETL
jgi:hypothetical protein